MTFRSSILPHLLLLLVGFAVALPAQRKGGSGQGGADIPDEANGRATRARQKEIEQREQAEWASLTPEERLERRIKRGSKAYCRFVVSCKPEKLMPGQAGMMLVAAVLQGKAVMPAPARIEIMGNRQDSPVSVGALMIRPAEVGTLAKAYIGRPVYENFAVFEIPVTMGAEAEVGQKHSVMLDLKFDLYDGDSAQPVGRFIERVVTVIEVGTVPDPKVEGRPDRPDSPMTAPSVLSDGMAGSAAPTPDAKPAEALGGSAIQAVVNPAESGAEPAVEPGSEAAGLPLASEEQDGLPMPLLFGGGAIVLAILLLLLRKK